MLTCNDAYVLIVRTIDDPRIPGEKRAALRQHLVSCARCRDEYDTQHEVRRLLALHIQDQLPAGFDDRLRARLAQTSRPLPSGVLRETPAPSAVRRLLDVQSDRRPDTRGRTWALRLIPLAATLALMVAGAAVREVAPPAVSSDASTDTPGAQAGAQSDAFGASPGQPRAFTTIVIKRDDDGVTRRQRPSAVSTNDVAHVPDASPPAEDDRPHGSGAVADSGIAAGDASRAAASRAAKEAPRTSDIAERVPAAEPRGQGRQDRERVASRERVAGRERDVRGERDARSEGDAEDERAAERERAASQRPGILPRPATPFPQARPAMPAPGPPATVPDRTIPPW